MPYRKWVRAMPNDHALLNPSGAARWLGCTPSVRISLKCPPPPPSEYAEEGTRAHAVAEAKLRFENNEITDGQLKARIKKRNPDGEMEEATDFYVNEVLDIKAAAGEHAELMVEQKFSLDEWVPESFGTSDAVVLTDDTIHVIDLKYGKGIRVSAKGNPQLRLYALGAASLFDGVNDFKTVRMTIIQPRLDHISTDEMPMEDLLKWAEEEVKPKAQMAFNGEGEVTPGDWCRWCPAAATCRARAEKNLELARMDFNDPDLLSDDELGEVLAKGEELKKWVEKVEAYVQQEAIAGKHFDGWKIVEGRSTRKITDQIKAAELLKKAGFEEAVLFSHELYGITQLEKNCGKKKLAEVLGDLIHKPPGKPTLVPESDKREAINTAEKVAEDF